MSLMEETGEHDAAELNTMEEYISNGVRLEFQSSPERETLKNTPAVANNSQFVRERLAYYRSLGTLRVLSPGEKPHLVQPLHIILKDGRKPRLVLDMSRNLNDHLFDYRLRYETVEAAVKLSSPGCWYGKHDLSACYLSFPVHLAYQQYLVFEFEGKHYQFTGLPFGLSSAPRIVTSLLGVVATAIKAHGVRLVRYLDDFLYVGKSPAEVKRAMRIAANIFKAAGLVLNTDKSAGPLQRIEFLGIIIDSLSTTLECSEERMKEISTLCSQYLPRPNARRREVESLAGKLSFAATVLPGARPFTRRLFDAIRNTKRGMHFVHDWPSAKLDLQWWQRHIRTWNGKAKWRSSEPIVLGSDASVSGFGFHIMSVPDVIPPSFRPALREASLGLGSGFAGTWSPEHIHLTNKSDYIQWAEFAGVVFLASVYAPFLNNCTVKFLVDNGADVHIINRARTKDPGLAHLSRCLAALATKHNFAYWAEHIPGKENVTNDLLSRPKIHKGDPIAAAADFGIHLSHVSFVRSAECPLLTSRDAGGRFAESLLSLGWRAEE
jgi:hypothetical protein